jgi:ABC-type sugar transport system ATPase subunit
VTLEQITKAFGSGHPAVRDLSLDIAEGEMLVLVGPSGCGKSTVLRLVAGLESPTSGRILIDGEDVTSIPPQRRDLAMVFQNYALYPHMTVRENLGFGLRSRGVDRQAIDASVSKAASMLGIADLLDRKPAQLSGGQRQRVAVGRALARSARAYLLDEPLSNLDPLLRVETRTELALLHRQIRATMIYVTHDQEEAMTLGTRIALMRDGRIEQVGPPLELYRRPRTRFVAGFIGSPAMNLVTSSIVRDETETAIASPFLARPLRMDPPGAAPGDVVLGFRAQDTAVCAEPDADAVANVSVVEPLGPQTLLHVDPVSAPDLRIRLIVSADLPVRVGDRIPFQIRRDRLHLFDVGTGVRVR